MDHLPLPESPLIGIYEIPFLAKEQYDGGDFYTYPERAGWAFEVNHHGFIFYHRGCVETIELEIGPFIQTWLYFGLLSASLGIEVRPEQFKQTSSNGNCELSSALLSELIGAWTTRLVELDDDTLVCRINTVHQMIAYASAFVLSHLDHVNMIPGSIMSRIYLSLALLGEYLTQALTDMARHKELAFYEQVTWASSKNDCAAPILQLMRRNGWCPARLKCFSLAEFMCIGTLWYNANIRPPGVQDRHEQCNSQACFSMQVDLQHYQPQHSRAACSCRFVHPTTGEVGAIIRSGSVPLVRVKNDSQVDNLELEVGTIGAGKSFIAISHVWADGKGNKNANSLPGCAVQDIQMRVNRAANDYEDAKNVWFWMDTLCLPLEPRDLRRLSIANMSEPYRQATAVLVLDSYLRDTKVEHMEALELLARINASNWTTRLWTFSESRLAKRVLFDFKDLVVEPNAIADEHWYTLPVPCKPNHRLWSTMVDSSTAIPLIRPNSVTESILDIRAALSSRTTSWKPDEALCLGGILDVDLVPIIESDDDRKMETLWMSLEVVPTGFLFMNTKAKEKSTGTRWAPSTLMSDLEIPVGGGLGGCDRYFPEAYPTQGGLVVRLPTVVFKMQEPAELSLLTGQKLVQDVYETDALETQTFFPLQSQTGVWYTCYIGKQWHEHVEKPDLRSSNLAILLSATLPAPATASKSSVAEIVHVPGVLVAYPRNSCLNSSPCSARAIVHVDITVDRGPQDMYTSIKKCKDVLYPRHATEIYAFIKANKHKQLRKAFRDWISDYSGLEEIKRVARSYDLMTGSDFQDEASLLWCISSNLAKFCFWDIWCHVEVLREPMEWCVD